MHASQMTTAHCTLCGGTKQQFQAPGGAEQCLSAWHEAKQLKDTGSMHAEVVNDKAFCFTTAQHSTAQHSTAIIPDPKSAP